MEKSTKRYTEGLSARELEKLRRETEREADELVKGMVETLNENVRKQEKERSKK